MKPKETTLQEEINRLSEKLNKNHEVLLHPYGLRQKGLLYDTLKKEYNELRIRHDRAYAEKILAEAKRDKCIEVLQFASEELNRTGAGEGEWIYKLLMKINKTLKNNSK